MLLEDHGLIGDMQSASLVGRDGSVDFPQAFSHLTLILAAREISRGEHA